MKNTLLATACAVMLVSSAAYATDSTKTEEKDTSATTGKHTATATVTPKTGKGSEKTANMGKKSATGKAAMEKSSKEDPKKDKEVAKEAGTKSSKGAASKN